MNDLAAVSSTLYVIAMAIFIMIVAVWLSLPFALLRIRREIIQVNHQLAAILRHANRRKELDENPPRF